MENTYELYLKVKDKVSKNEISEKINVNKNTISNFYILTSGKIESCTCISSITFYI